MAKNSGVIQYKDARVVKEALGNYIVLNKNALISINNKEGRELEQHRLVVGAVISVPDGGTVSKGQIFAKWEPHSVPIITEQSGVVQFRDFVENVSMKIEVDAATGFKGIVILDYREDIHPQILIKDQNTGAVLSSYSIPSGAHVVVTK